MAIREIVTLDEDFLRKKSREITNFDSRLSTLIDDMIDTLIDAEGAGLAAVQVGVLRRVIVVDTKKGPVALVNPEILETKGSQIGAEGCLSFPNIFGDVKRPKYVKVKAYDKDGNPFTMEGEGILARAFCHEIDHLNGKVFKDFILDKELPREDA